MPGNLDLADPGDRVLPRSLSTQFSESLVYPIQSISYHDGTVERSLIEDGVNFARAVRTWRLSKRLSLAQFQELLSFWETETLGGLHPFYFYDPFGVAPDQRIGSNYDPSGSGALGRHTVFFRGSWSHTLTLGRVSVPQLLLVACE